MKNKPHLSAINLHKDVTATFENIQAAEIEKSVSGINDLINQLKGFNYVSDILERWYFKSLMTKGSLSKKWELPDLIIYLHGRIYKKGNAEIEKIKSRLQTVKKADRKIQSISISVEWAKNRTWGYCPMAEVRVCYTDNTCNNYKSGRITGCGYDKESTAIAQALNQCNYLLHAMYVKKEANHTKENREIFGYGSGYGVRPYFEGGVGVSCYYAIFAAIGYEWKGISHGKTFDVYQVEVKTA